MHFNLILPGICSVSSASPYYNISCFKARIECDRLLISFDNAQNS